MFFGNNTVSVLCVSTVYFILLSNQIEANVANTLWDVLISHLHSLGFSIYRLVNPSDVEYMSMLSCCWKWTHSGPSMCLPWTHVHDVLIHDSEVHHCFWYTGTKWINLLLIEYFNFCSMVLLLSCMCLHKDVSFSKTQTVANKNSSGFIRGKWTFSFRLLSLTNANKDTLKELKSLHKQPQTDKCMKKAEPETILGFWFCNREVCKTQIFISGFSFFIMHAEKYKVSFLLTELVISLVIVILYTVVRKT